MDLICLGELLIDMFPAELGRPHAEVSAFRPVPGGAPANAAVAARRLGAEAAFIGKVGDDPFGHFLVDVLAREGVETRGMRLDPEARTTMNLMAQPDANHYDCLFYRNPGADTRLRPDELDEALLRSTRAFHFGSLSLTDEPARSATVEAVKIAKAAGALISYDVNYRPTLWKSPEEAAAQARAMIRYADLVKVNEAELALLAGEGDITDDQRRAARHGAVAVCSHARPGWQLLPGGGRRRGRAGLPGGDGGRHRLRRRVHRRAAVAVGQGRRLARPAHAGAAGRGAALRQRRRRADRHEAGRHPLAAHRGRGGGVFGQYDSDVSAIVR